MGIKEEIDEMIEMNETAAPSTQSIETDAPGTEQPGTESPGTESPGTEAPGTEAPATAAPDEDELERYKKENEALRKQIEEAHARKGKSATKAPSTKAPATEPPISEMSFLSDEDDLDDIVRDPKELNKLLNKVFQAGVKTTRQQLGEGVLRSIPDIVKLNVQTVLALREANESFYSDNKDLQPFKKVVAAVFEELSSEHPDWTVDECLKETGEETRRRLELHKQVQQPKKERKPNLPPGTKGKAPRQKPPTSRLLKEIDEMNASLEED